MSSPTTVHWLGDRLRAEQRIYPGQGHWLLAGGQRTKLVSDLHRWLIMTFGEALLVPQESEE